MFCVLSSPQISYAESETHDGFFLRLNLVGIGYTKATAEENNDKLEISGISNLIDIGIGGTVYENLIIHGNIFGPIIIQPSLKVYDNGILALEGDLKGNVNSIGFGAGVTYYLMPINVFLTGIIGLATMSINDDDGNTIGETKHGLSLLLAAGKEWFVSDEWGLGFSGSLIFQRLPDKNNDLKFMVMGLGANFSVTYN